jgi:hypothetical protein
MRQLASRDACPMCLCALSAVTIVSGYGVLPIIAGDHLVRGSSLQGGERDSTRDLSLAARLLT